MGVPEPLASLVATRVLVELGEELVPRRALRPKAPRDPLATEGGDGDGADQALPIERPAIRLTERGSHAEGE